MIYLFEPPSSEGQGACAGSWGHQGLGGLRKVGVWDISVFSNRFGVLWAYFFPWLVCFLKMADVINKRSFGSSLEPNCYQKPAHAEPQDGKEMGPQRTQRD